MWNRFNYCAQTKFFLSLLKLLKINSAEFYNFFFWEREREPDKIKVGLMDKFSLEDVNPHLFPINACLTLVDENLTIVADGAMTDSVQILKHCWCFLIVFSWFYIKCWNVFWCRSCGNRYSFTKSKVKKYYWELLIVGYKIFLGVSQNLAARILQQFDFFFGRWLLPTFEKQTIG